MHRIPYSATNFWTYEVTKKALRGRMANEAARAWAAGAFAGLVACTAAYPLDLLRTRIAAETQRGPAQQYGRVRSALGRILAQQGVAGLYKGLGATLAQVVPGLAFNFCFYDSFKRLALQHQLRQGQAQGQGQGQQQQLGQQQACCQQQQQQQEGQQQGQQGRQHHQLLAQCQGQQAGGLGAQCQEWREAEARSSGSGAAAAAMQGQGRGPAGMQAQAAPESSCLPSPPPLTSALCACAAGLCTSTLTFPLDVVRRRLQVYERGELGRLRYGDVVRAVYAEGGLKAFYRGIGPEYAKVLPGMAIAFTTYEALKRLTGAAP